MQLPDYIRETLENANSYEFLIPASIDMDKYGIGDYDYANINYPFISVNGSKIRLDSQDWEHVYDVLIEELM